MPATTWPVDGSMTSPRALTATSAATTSPSGLTIAVVPSPPFIACSRPFILPTVAPAPAPTFPSAILPVVAACAAADPQSAPGRIDGSPTLRSKRIAAGTIGTVAPPYLKPMPRCSRCRTTPVAASRPNALPPARTIAWTTSTVAVGARRSVSRVPGALPRTSTPAVAPCSAMTTVHPVGRALSVCCPTLSP